MKTQIKTLAGAVLAVVLLASSPSSAANTQTEAPGDTKIADAQNCVMNLAVLDGVTLAASRSFGITQDQTKAIRPLVDVILKITDANTSITRLDTTCTVSADQNTTDITPQTVTVSGGVGTQNDALVFQKASPGTKNILVSFDLLSMPDFECTISVGAGSGAAADLLTVDVRTCAR